ncbi:hypothetical protein [Embleya sp. NPDC050493]|uniref:hypothetical protein n=1 Tax=Embleya sp. NPDC050493 TaxID=3363989 RepID=UPI0037A6BF9E
MSVRGKGVERTIEDVLATARVLVGEYEDLDLAAAREALARDLDDDPPHPADPPSRAAGALPRHERAARQLAVTDVLVLTSPKAAARLGRLVNDHRVIDPRGALVFACLLHVSGRDEGAMFWWRFAAGGGSHHAAWCLYLEHRSRGETRDADYWLEQARVLSALTRATPPPAFTPAEVDRPLLPADAREAIRAQCDRGDRPRLPRRLEAVMRRLRVEGDDDYPGVPQPCGDLPDALTAASR